MGYVLKVKCSNCDATYKSGSLTADFYNDFNHFICSSCGQHGFYDSIEKWESFASLWKPWTWWKGEWVKIEQEKTC